MSFELTFGGGSTSLYVALPGTSSEIIVAGGLTVTRSKDAFDTDALVAAFDRNGKKLWEHTYGETGDDNIYDGVALPTGGFLFAGTKGKPGEFLEGSCWVFQVDKTGAIEWERVFPKEFTCEFNDLDWQLNQGSAVVSKKGLVVRLDQTGKVLWQKDVNDAARELGELKTVNILTSGHVMLGGDHKAVTKSGGTFRGVWVHILNRNGEEPNDNVYARDQHHSFIQTSIPEPDGGVLFGGHSDDDALVFKVDAQGNYVYHSVIASTQKGKVDANKIYRQTDGSLLLVGTLKRPAPAAGLLFGLGGTPTLDGWAIKFNSDGKRAWESTFGSKELNDYVSAIAPLPGRRLALAGGRGTGGINSIFKAWVFTIDDGGKLVK